MMDPSLEALRQATHSPLPHPDLESVNRFAAQVTSWLAQEFSGLPERSVGRTASPAEMKELLNEPPPEQGLPFESVLAEFRDRVAPFGLRPNHPRFLAFIPSAPTFLSVMGDWLCAGINFFAGVWMEAPGPTQVELVVLDWFKELLGYPREAQGIVTSGGSEANLTALVVARDRLAWADRPRAVLYMTQHRHWSLDRAAKVMGLRPEQVRVLPGDSDHPSRLAKAVAHDRHEGKHPWAMVATAGATNTGAVDPLHELAEVCGQEKLWLHVDAAYGWPSVLTAEGRDLLRGIDRADSITLDPHKWFAQTFEAGCVLVRAGGELEQTFSLRPDYMQDVAPAPDEVNFADLGLALTRRFRALKIWLSVKVLGLAWFRSLIEHCCRLAELAQGLLLAAGKFEILSPRRLSILCFRFVPSSRKSEAELDRLNLAMAEELRQTGRAFLSSTRLEGKVALRMCFVNWRTTAGDVEEVVDLLARLGDERNC
jgi:glutamate/tyrosine decarboxylase-like PLP-dependent enzyme